MVNSIKSLMDRMEAEAEETGMALHPGYRDVSCTWDCQRGGVYWTLPVEVPTPNLPVTYRATHEAAVLFFRRRTGLYE